MNIVNKKIKDLRHAGKYPKKISPSLKKVLPILRPFNQPSSTSIREGKTLLSAATRGCGPRQRWDGKNFRALK
jgi:hypothetical protein